MHQCGSCSGNCENCGQCAGSLVLTPAEIMLLEKLGQIPFLPVARTAQSADPIYLEDSEHPPEQYTKLLILLEKKGLISLDFDIPLKGFHSSGTTSLQNRSRGLESSL